MTNYFLFDSITKDSLDILLSNNLLHKLHTYSIDQIKLFTREFYQYVNYFPKYLSALLWKVSDDKIKFCILDNFIDEVGGLNKIQALDTAETHPNLFLRFANAFGLKKDNIEQYGIKPYTKKLLKDLYELSMEQPFYVSLGGLAPGTESLSPIWINEIYKGLKGNKNFSLSKEDFFYFTLHIRVDIEHSDKLKKVIAPHLDQKQCYDQLHEGAIHMANIMRDFFNAIEQDLATMPTQTYQFNKMGFTNSSRVFL